jgi:DNA-binding YbaB/EbfC family protein
MTDFNEILKQARQMQEQMQAAQKEAARLVLVGESGAGLVRVHMNGHHDVQKVELDSDLLSEDKDIIEDLIAAAFNDAVKKLAERNQTSLAGMASGIKLPDGFKFPF